MSLESPDSLDYQVTSDAAWELFSTTGIHPASSEELSLVAVEDGVVVGAVVSSLTSTEYSLSIAVRPDWQGRGVGRSLVDACLKELESYTADVGPVTAEITCVHPWMAGMLQRRGFKLKRVEGYHVAKRVFGDESSSAGRLLDEVVRAGGATGRWVVLLRDPGGTETLLCVRTVHDDPQSAYTDPYTIGVPLRSLWKAAWLHPGEDCEGGVVVFDSADTADTWMTDYYRRAQRRVVPLSDIPDAHGMATLPPPWPVKPKG